LFQGDPTPCCIAQFASMAGLADNSRTKPFAG
jgi:hypothetical protein